MLIPSSHRDAFLLGQASASPTSGMTFEQIDAATAEFDAVKVPDPTSITSMTDFIATYLKWVDFQFAMIDRQYQALKYFVSLGVAKCDDLNRYNFMAKVVFFEAEFMRRALKEAGVPNVPMVPRPGLFGHTAEEFIDYQNNVVDIDFEVNCGADGYPTAGLRSNPLKQTVKQSPLGAVPAIAAPLIWGGALLLGGLAAWLVGAGLSSILRAFPGTVSAQLTHDMHQAAVAGDAKRADMIKDCLSQEMAKLTPAQQQDVEMRRAVFTQCQTLAKTAIPDRKTPKLPTGGWGVGKTILYIGLGVGAIFLSVGAYRMATARGA